MSGVTPINWQNLFLGDHFYRDHFSGKSIPKIFRLICGCFFWGRSMTRRPCTSCLKRPWEVGMEDDPTPISSHGPKLDAVNLFVAAWEYYYVWREWWWRQLELLAVSEERWFAWLVPTEEIVWKREACCVLWSRRPADTSLTFAASLRQLTTDTITQKEREREIEETSVLGLHLVAKQQQ